MKQIKKNEMLKVKNGIVKIKNDTKSGKKNGKKITKKNEKNINVNGEKITLTNVEKNENERNPRMCIDPINGTTCTYGTLRSRKKRNKEKYKDVKPIECLVKTENQQ